VAAEVMTVMIHTLLLCNLIAAVTTAPTLFIVMVIVRDSEETKPMSLSSIQKQEEQIPDTNT